MGITRQLTYRLTGLIGLLLLNTPFQLAAESGYGLTVSPEKCFVLESTTECEISVSLQWHVKSKGDYCLFQLGQSTPLNCWQSTNQAIFEHLLITNTDTEFELKTLTDNQSVFKAELKLFKQIKKLKKRRRNPWSFY